MNQLLGLARRTVLVTNRLPIQTSIRTVLNNREWRPNEQAPVTVEDRAATARKYNMLPEDYKPYPPEYNAGDMPDVAPAGRFFDRSPWEDYDYPTERQNWNEPRHPRDHIVYDKTRWGNADEKQPAIGKELLKLLILPVAIIFGIYALREVHFMNPTFRSPMVEQGVVHYTFEKDDHSGRGVRY